MAKNLDFDFEKFAVEAIKSIDEIRSAGIYGATPSASKESRINAFYRAIGLPAVRTPNSIVQNDLFNSGNLVTNVLINDVGSVLNELSIRELDFNMPITKSEIERLANLDINGDLMRNLGVDKSDRIKQANETRRTRGCMFPMVVNGAIPIFPQQRRVAGAFLDEEALVVSGNKYKRPLIETIITIRLKMDGAGNSTNQSNINSDLDTQNINFLGVKEDIKRVLALSTNNIDDILYGDKGIVRNINKAKKEIGNRFIIIPAIANIAEKKPDIVVTEDTTGAKLTEQQAQMEYGESLKNAALALFEFEDTFGSSVKRNLKDSLLGSELLSVVIPQDGATKKDEDTIKEKEQKELNRLISGYRALDLVLGQFSGLAGTDVLLVLYALFSIDMKHLIGLLNSESQARLKDLDIGANSFIGKASIGESVTELEKKTKEIYERVNGSIGKASQALKAKNQKKNVKG